MLKIVRILLNFQVVKGRCHKESAWPQCAIGHFTQCILLVLNVVYISSKFSSHTPPLKYSELIRQKQLGMQIAVSKLNNLPL